MAQRKKTGISRPLELGGRYRRTMIVACILFRLDSMFTLCPFLYIWLVLRDALAALPDLSMMDMRAMTFYGWAALGLAVGGSLPYSLALLSSHLGVFHTVKNMRSQILHHLTSLSLGFFSQSSSGKLRKTIRKDTTRAEDFLACQFPDMTGSAVTAVMMLVILPFSDQRLDDLSILLLIAGFTIQILMTSEKSMSYTRKYQDASEQMNNGVAGYVCGIPVVKMFQQTIYFFKSFYVIITYRRDSIMEHAPSCQGSMVTFNAIINASFAVLIPTSIPLIDSGQYSELLLDLIFYILFIPGNAGTLNKILFSDTYRMMTQETVRRVDSPSAEASVVEDAPTRIPDQDDVEFRSVTFTYPGTKAPALFHLLFRVPEGKTTALIGVSDSGKTTATTLIPWFWDVQEGAVCIGDVPASQIPKQELMDRIAFVFQDSQLLRANTLENVRASRSDVTRERMVEALRSAQYNDILEKLLKDVDTVLGTEGVYLSDGEQQRTALIRTILKDAPIVLLDKVTAFAGPENEHKIQMAFERLTQGKTALMVAHQLPTIQNTDEILVLEQGIAAKRGTHDLLVARNKVYASMQRDYQTSVAWSIGREGHHAS